MAALDDWAARPVNTYVSADYRLLNDNLLDLSHETYIHGSTIGNEDGETLPTTVQSQRGREPRRACAPRDAEHRTSSDVCDDEQSSGRINRWQLPSGARRG